MNIISDTKSRAEYMKNRRATKTSFSVLIDKEHGEKLKIHLLKNNLTKTQWLISKIEQDTKK